MPVAATVAPAAASTQIPVSSTIDCQPRRTLTTTGVYVPAMAMKMVAWSRRPHTRRVRSDHGPRWYMALTAKSSTRESPYTASEMRRATSPPLTATSVIAPTSAGGTARAWLQPRSAGRGTGGVSVVSGSGSDLLWFRSTAQPSRRPPVGSAEQSHQRGDDQGSYQRCIHDDRHGHADTDRFDGNDAGEREGEEDAGHDRRGAGHEAAAALEAVGDRRAIVAGAMPRLLHSREQEHLVVHREAEDDAEQQHRDRRVKRTGGEAEDRREMTLFEDPHQRAEGGAERERVHQHRFERKHHRPEQDGQDDQRGQDHEPDCQRRMVDHVVHQVDVERGVAGHLDCGSSNPVLSADS